MAEHVGEPQAAAGGEGLAGRIAAVLLDCYGTLVDIVDLHFIELFGEICTANSLSLSGRELWDRWIEEGRGYAKERGRDRDDPLSTPEPPFLPFREIWATQFVRVFRGMECDGDAAAAYARMDELLSSATAYPEVPEVLAALRKRYRLAVLSNADEDHLQICLTRNQLSFESVISSEGVASYKPYPRIFEQGAERLGLEPAQILYVGDSPVPDVLGARAAGLAVAWLNRAGIPRPETMPAPDLEIRDLRGLLPALLPETR